MYMDDREIEYMYRTAAKKNKQLGILAELNGTSKLKICDILYKRGVLEVEKGNIAEKYMIAKLISEGMADADIESQLGVTNVLINNVRKDYRTEMWVFGLKVLPIQKRERACGIRKEIVDSIKLIKRIEKEK